MQIKDALLIMFIAIARTNNYERIALTNFRHFILPSPCLWKIEVVTMTQNDSV